MQDLPFQTPTQWAALAIALVAGLLLGLALAPRHRKWRERFHNEELAHSSFRTRAETELKERNTRVRALEEENLRLRETLQKGGAALPAGTAAVAASGSSGWFGRGGDDLTRIRGIDEARAKQLHKLGFKSFADIEDMRIDQALSAQQELGMGRGAIAAAGWREQAGLLRAGRHEEHAKHYG